MPDDEETAEQYTEDVANVLTQPQDDDTPQTRFLKSKLASLFWQAVVCAVLFFVFCIFTYIGDVIILSGIAGVVYTLILMWLSKKFSKQLNVIQHGNSEPQSFDICTLGPKNQKFFKGLKYFNYAMVVINALGLLFAVFTTIVGIVQAVEVIEGAMCSINIGAKHGAKTNGILVGDFQIAFNILTYIFTAIFVMQIVDLSLVLIIYQFRFRREIYGIGSGLKESDFN